MKYNRHYLETEYNFAKRSAQQVDKWQQIEKDGDKYNLQYRTAEDDKVRQSHAAMDNITLPPSDAFWNRYFPPNGWNCRCVAVQVRKGKYAESDSDEAIKLGDQATTIIGKNGKNTAAIFRFNPGKDKKVFPDGHPYTSGDCGKLAAVWHTLNARQRMQLAAEGDKCRAKKIVGEIADTLKTKKVKTYSNGGSVETYPKLEDKNSSDYNKVLESADFFAKQGDKTAVLPRIHVKDDPRYDMVYGALKGTPYYGKNPDILRNGIFYEHEGFQSDNPKRAFKNMLNRGLKQSDKIIIEDCGLSDSYMLRNVGNRIFVNKQNISEVWVKKEESLRLLYKNAKTP